MDKFPYEKFGKQLKKIRTEAHKSILELSGAMELDPDRLKKIETGEERPSEELIVLLISHFELEDAQAFDLWKLAGYDKQEQGDEKQQGRPITRTSRRILSSSRRARPGLLPMADPRPRRTRA